MSHSSTAEGIEPCLVVVSAPTPKVRVLAFNRPEKRNALSQHLIQQFLDELLKASSEPEVRVIVVTGNETAFSAGADIKEIARMDGEGARRCRYLENLCHGMRSIKVPVIAAVEGMALGGGFEVALMCDMIFSSATAKFGFPEVNIGLIPGAGGTQRLTNAVGKFRAMKMILLGDHIRGDEASAFGLVASLSEPGTVLSHAIEVAARLSEQSSSAIALAKETISRADDLGRDDEFERSMYYFAFGTKDKVEGVSAFLEKRPPQWQ
ncbi:ClpP/crotonase-like domain-containing protein [Phialemonium atrogriseum]|uniref:ClpP/crotonase-like domain-containing protein n=1 Tax=Phialemonium atrogriseum TaxID=1093897 RepID=A0AAJ0FIN5_9PEZI|nr:ClpP/crotonase-like domain-containing protein [Phialemonium atrogriseum]KAK1763499.1 ClpP/crotonase-like domain-containing protein [Phialemonium atrogriseum]